MGIKRRCICSEDCYEVIDESVSDDEGSVDMRGCCCREMAYALVSGSVIIRDGVAYYGEVPERKTDCPDGSIFIIKGNRGIRARRCLFCGSDLQTSDFGGISE